MKKQIFSAAVMGTLGACGLSAHAQSSVTLYGLVDAGFVFNNNAGGKHQYEETSGNLQGSRWGMQGTEDLGGGLKAIFRLENGFSVNTGALGQGGDEFGRAAWVGLSNSYGTVRLGRQYDPLTTYMAGYTAGGGSGHGVVINWSGPYGSHPGDVDNLGGTNRTNNSIRVDTIKYRGLQASGFYSIGGKAGDFTNNQIYSLATSYETGPFSAGAAYLNARDPNFSFYGDKPSSSLTASNMSSPVYSGFSAAHSMGIFSTGAAYSLGQAVITAEYSNIRFDNLASNGPALNPLKLSGNTIFNIEELNVAYRFTPETQVGVSFAHTNRSGVGSLASGAYNQLDLEGDYALSKATDLYLVGIYQHANGTDSTGKAAVAQIDGLTASANNRQIAVTAGIRHRF
jgi:predicted porin